MKKLILMLLTLAIATSLVACDIGGNGGNGNGTNGGDTGNSGNTTDFDTSKVTFASAYAKAQELGFEGTLDEFIELISGKDGVDGEDGVSVSHMYIDADGSLMAYLSDGSLINCGKATGAQGAQGDKGDKGDTGATIKEITFDEEGRMIITLTDGTVLEPIELPEKEEHQHTYGEWVSYGGSTEMLFTVCKTCKEIVWKFGTCSTHTFTTTTVAPTCTAQGYDHKVCSVCNYEEKINYTDIIDHDYSDTYSYNGSFHWYACANCTATTSYAEHTIGDDGYCTVCYAPLAPSEGVIYDLSSDKTYAEVIDYTGTATRMMIADTYEGVPVKTIMSDAFRNSTITAVSIPDSVTSIGDDAFYDCSKLTSVTFGDNSQLQSIGSQAFRSCSSLTSIVIPDSVTSIGNYAFEDCSSLNAVHISDIAAWCNISFENSYANPLWYAKDLYLNGELITDLVIPDSVTSIGYRAFSCCSKLTSVTFGDNSQLQSIGEWAFESCSSLTSIVIPDSVTSIGYVAFFNCSSLTSVTFSDNSKLQSIGSAAFYSCSSLEIIVIPDSVTIIGSNAFESCSKLTNIVIPDSVTSIGSSAFFGCETLTSVVIPDSVTSIGNHAFNSCSSLRKVYYGGTAEEWAEISIGSNNSNLKNATRYYYSESEPTASGYYWHYDSDGNVAIW